MRWPFCRWPRQDKDNAARAATAAKRASHAAIVRRTRALMRRLKSHPNHALAMGEQLGIVAPNAGGNGVISALSAAAEVLRPDLRSRGAHGETLIGFAKRGHTGILLYGRRAGGLSATQLVQRCR